MNLKELPESIVGYLMYSNRFIQRVILLTFCAITSTCHLFTSQHQIRFDLLWLICIFSPYMYAWDAPYAYGISNTYIGTCNAHVFAYSVSTRLGSYAYRSPMGPMQCPQVYVCAYGNAAVTVRPAISQLSMCGFEVHFIIGKGPAIVTAKLQRHSG